MRLALLSLLLITLPAGAAAQAGGELPFGGDTYVPPLSDEAFVSLLTMLPGNEVYSAFGHTAVRVHDPATGLDRTYNYGTFDFQQPNFVLRFLRGQLDYRLATSTFDRTIAEYRFLRRPVLEQRLDLAPEDRQAVFRYLEVNRLPENREYRYDFLFDNCSTRPLDALEWALGPRLTLGDYQPPAGSFRDLVSPYVAHDPLLSFGIDLGFGRPVDRPPTPREAVFLPLELFDAAEAATVDGRRLVASTDTVFWINGSENPQGGFDFLTIMMVIVLAGGVALTVLRPASLALRVLDITLLAIAGLLGLVLALLWFATEHYVTRMNADLLWAWPTHLVAAAMLARRNDPARLRVYWALAAAASAAVALLSVLGWLALPLAATPLALLLALRLADRARPRTPAHALA